jgi:hypothetical protein
VVRFPVRVGVAGARRTPALSLGNVFRRAASGLPGGDGRALVVARALDHLQAGFDAHYAGSEASNEDVLVGDNYYAWAVETIARLDEPRFVAVASRMIRDGSGRIAAGEDVTLDFWAPHLADLLDVISQEGPAASERRISAARDDLERDAG